MQGVSLQIVSWYRAEMISVEIWRARIGLFNCNSCSSLSASSNRSPSTVPMAPFRRGTRRKNNTHVPSDQSQDSEPSKSTSLPTPPLAASSSLSSVSRARIHSTRLFLLLDVSVVSLLIIAVICLFLMTSGDIETNPGPKHRGENDH